MLSTGLIAPNQGGKLAHIYPNFSDDTLRALFIHPGYGSEVFLLGLIRLHGIVYLLIYTPDEFSQII